MATIKVLTQGSEIGEIVEQSITYVEAADIEQFYDDFEASEALDEGDFVHIFDDSGTTKVEKAIATDNTKLADGFILADVASSGTARVYYQGKNDKVAKGTFAATDKSKKVCLSASTGGACQKTVPATTGNAVQPLGDIIAVGSTYVTVDFKPGNVVIRA